jgi:hypothetical protein
VGLLYMWALSTCWPTVNVGPQHMWANNTYGCLIVVFLQYRLACCTSLSAVHVGPNSCGSTLYVGLLYMWAQNTCVTTVLTCGPTASTVHVGLLYSGPPILVGLQYMLDY